MLHPDFIIVSILVILKIISMIINIGGYPYIENDEATYTLRAMSFAENGKLDYYTYWYDHAPVGWILMSPLLLINSLVGHSIDEILLLRLFMVVLAAASVALTYFIGLKLFKRRLPSIIAAIVIISSPLAAYYQRRVLLDNVMIFVVLASVLILLHKPKKLSSYAISGAVFGVAILSKINAFFLIPAMWLMIWQQQAHKIIRRHAVVLWTMFMGSVTSLWLLYAGLKGELLPYNAHPETGDFEKITLIDTLKFQSARGGEPKFPWDPTSNIYPNAIDWFNRDKLLVILFSISFIICTLLLLNKVHRKKLLFIWLVVILFSIFIIRGGVVLGFYFLPLLPFGSLLIGYTITQLIRIFPVKRLRKFALITLALALLITNALPLYRQWDKDETSNQLKAVQWISNNVKNKDALIISDNYALPYLIEDGYKNVDYQFKVEYDPEINERKYKDDWRNGVYIIVSHEVLRQIKEGTTPFVRAAFDHSVKVADFTTGSSSYINTSKYISTNGDWAQVYQIKSDAGVYLQDAWQAYKQTYIRSYGQVVNDTRKKTKITTSYNQAITMQMAVAENDQPTFDGVWQWAKDHFQNRTQDSLLSSEWVSDKDDQGKLLDSNTNSLADAQTAVGLLQAYQKWGNIKYLSEAQNIISDIKKFEFRKLGNRYVQIPFTTQKDLSSYTINPSYSDPYSYSMFEKFDLKNKDFWNKAGKDYYKFIDTLQEDNKFSLVPDWITMNSRGVVVASPPNSGSDSYGYEAFRISQTLSRSFTIANDKRALKPLKKLATFYETQINSKNGATNNLFAIYDLKAKPIVNYEDVSTNVSMLSALRITSSTQVNTLENTKIAGQYKMDGYWGPDAFNIRNQQAAWKYYDLFYDRVE